MAIAVTTVATVVTGALATLTSGSYTPTANEMQAPGASATGSINGETITSISVTHTGTGAFTLVAYTPVASSNCGGGIGYARTGASPGAGTLTVNFASAGTDNELIVAEVTGTDPTTPVDVAASTSAGAATTAVTPVLTLGAAPTTADATLAVFAGRNVGAVPSLPSGTGTFTDLGSNNHVNPCASIRYSYRLSSTSTNVTPAGLGTIANFGAAVVFKAASAAAPNELPVRSAQPGKTWLRRFHHRQYVSTSFTVSLTPVAQALATTWNTLAQVADTNATTWNTLAPVAQTKATTWNVAAQVAQTKATTWNVLGQVAATRATTWNVRAQVASTRATTWNVAASVTGTRATTWNTLAAVTAATRATTWNTLAQVQATRATLWNVASSLTQVTQTKATTWNVAAQVAGTRATTWDVLARVTAATRATTWNTLTVVTAATRATTWNVRAQVQQTRATTWNVRAQVAQTRATTWNTLTVVTAATRSTTWHVRAAITATRATLWNVLSNAGPPSGFAYKAGHPFVLYEADHPTTDPPATAGWKEAAGHGAWTINRPTTRSPV